MKRKGTMALCVLVLFSMLFTGVAFSAEVSEDAPTVTIMMYKSTDEEKDQAYFDKIAAGTGIHIDFVPAPADYVDNVTKQTTLLSSGDTTIDIFHCDEPMLSTFMNAGFLEPITEAVAVDIGNFPTSYVEDMCSLNGEVYAVTTEVQPVMFFANQNMFEGSGLSYPMTQDEFVAAAQALTTDDVYGYGASWAKGFMYNDVERWIYAFDGDFFNWKDENTQKAIKFMWDCINTYKITPMAALADNYDAMNQKMADGKYGFIFQWQYVSGIFRDAGLLGEGGPIVITDIPTFANNKSLTGGWNYVINKSSENMDAAKTVMAYIASPAGQEAFGVRTSQIPANSKALESEVLQERIAGLDKALYYIENIPLLPRPTHPRINEIIDSIESVMQMYLTNEIDFDTCINNAQAEIERLTA